MTSRPKKALVYMMLYIGIIILWTNIMGTGTTDIPVAITTDQDAIDNAKEERKKLLRSLIIYDDNYYNQ